MIFNRVLLRPKVRRICNMTNLDVHFVRKMVTPEQNDLVIYPFTRLYCYNCYNSFIGKNTSNFTLKTDKSAVNTTKETYPIHCLFTTVLRLLCLLTHKKPGYWVKKMLRHENGRMHLQNMQSTDLLTLKPAFTQIVRYHISLMLYF